MSAKIVLDNQICHIAIEETTLTSDAINPGNHILGELTKVITVYSTAHGTTHSISILCSYLSDLDNSAILRDNQLLLMLNEQLFQIDIHNCAIQKYIQLDNVGCTFGIYETTQGYVVHGELGILMLNSTFELIWEFSGRDIFVSVTGKTAFTLTDTTIQLYDFDVFAKM